MDYKIAIVGEAFGAQEEVYKRPFVGAAGEMLNKLLIDAEIMPGPYETAFKTRDNFVWLTNVFNLRPKDNEIDDLCCVKKDLPKGYDYPPIKQSRYVRPEFLGELDRLKRELEEIKPNVVIALGNTACWGLLRRTGIDKLRGAITTSTLVPGLKVLPTYHPSFLLHGRYDQRPKVIMDLAKAKEASERAEHSRLHREVWLSPTLEDLIDFEKKHIDGCEVLAFDIENPQDQGGGSVSCISFAPDPTHAIVVPFFDARKPAYNYWSTLEDEVQAWLWVRRVLESEVEKVGQNGIYDMLHLWLAGIHVRNYTQDTMILHHSLQPEEKKGLGVLGSLYVDEDAWKTTLKDHGKKQSIKKDN